MSCRYSGCPVLGGFADVVIAHCCPKCNKSHYRVLYMSQTAVMWYPEYVNGRLDNSNPNRTTYNCECVECGEQFSFED